MYKALDWLPNVALVMIKVIVKEEHFHSGSGFAFPYSLMKELYII